MKRSLFQVLIFLSFLFLVNWCWFCWSPSYYFCIPVQIDDRWENPFIQLDIGKKSYQVKLDLGAEFSSLYPQDLSEIDKKPCGRHCIIGIRGSRHDGALYEVFGAKIHDLQVPKMKIVEETRDFTINAVISGDSANCIHSGRVGREVFNGKNFLLDFISSKVILCKDFKDLAKDGYDLESFVKVPFEMNRMGICLRAQTDVGEQILLLDTCSTYCFLRPPLGKDNRAIESFKTSSNWRSQKFIIGDFEFGPMNFSLFELTPFFDMIDGSLGMDFLKQHAIYIDSEKSIAYIQKSSAPSLPKA